MDEPTFHMQGWLNGRIVLMNDAQRSTTQSPSGLVSGLVYGIGHRFVILNHAPESFRAQSREQFYATHATPLPPLIHAPHVTTHGRRW